MLLKKIRKHSICSNISLFLVIFFLSWTVFGCSGGSSSTPEASTPISGNYVSGMTDTDGSVKLTSGDFSMNVDVYEQNSTESLAGAFVQAFPLKDGILLSISDPSGEHYQSFRFVSREEFDQSSRFAVVTTIAVGLAVVSLSLVAYDYISEPEEFPVQFVEIIENDDKVKKLCFQVDLQDIFNTISVVSAGHTLSAALAVKGAPAALRGVTAINYGFTKEKLVEKGAEKFVEWFAGLFPEWKEDFIDTCTYYYTNSNGEEIRMPYVSTMLPAKSGSTIGDFPTYTPDASDTQELNIVQTIPPSNSMGINPNTSISIFFDDEINPSTLNDLSVRVAESNGTQIYGDYSGVLSTVGNTILNFQPKYTLPESDTITVTLTTDNGLEDDGGNDLTTFYSFSFLTRQEIASPIDMGFESSETGWIFSGDGAIVLSPLGDISATEGGYMAGISTADNIGGLFQRISLNNTTSVLSSGPIDVPIDLNYISFDFNFISEEFDEYVGSEYDDISKVTIAGPFASVNKILTSVNITGVNDSFPVIFDGLTDAEETGWKKQTINISSLGSPITISFTVSDVGDEAFSSVTLIDNIYFE